MIKYERGMLAKSLAGHDKGSLYMIIDIDEKYVYLADGRYKTLDKLKKKNKQHVQIIHGVHDTVELSDTYIKRTIHCNEEEV
jgi:Ribosomal protein L14E/L6E/L27E